MLSVSFLYVLLDLCLYKESRGSAKLFATVCDRDELWKI